MHVIPNTIYNVKNNYKYNAGYNANQNVNFTGFGALNKKISSEKVKDLSSFISGMLNVDRKVVSEAMQGSELKNINFLKTLADKFNARNYYLDGSLKENPNTVLNIFKSVKNPTAMHYSIVSNSDWNMKDLERLFLLAKDKKSLNFIAQYQEKIGKSFKLGVEIPLGMLMSKFKKIYINSFDDFVPYIKFNISDPKMIENLDKIVESGKYKKEVYENKLKISALLKKLPENRVLNFDAFELGYSKKGIDFVSDITSMISSSVKDLNDSVSEKLLKIYRTTNEKNYDLRHSILQKSLINSPDTKKLLKEIQTLEYIYGKIDSDKKTSKFLRKIIKDVKISSAEELKELLDTVPARKGLIFHKNVINIINTTVMGSERTNALNQELMNPFYLPKNVRASRELFYNNGYEKKENIFSVIKTKIENKINKIRYSIGPVSIAQGSSAPVERTAINVKTSSLSGELEMKPLEVASRRVQKGNKDFEIVKTFKKAPNAKKLQVINDVNNIIGKKLGEKTFEKQKGIYSDNATKIRLKLLPLIFDSVKETRRADKLAGKKRSESANKDVVKLYQLITGQNRKLIRYMLLKTNADNSRMFEVKNIIEFINNANSKIGKNKKLNPNYKSSDAKAYYQHLYEALNDQYGKLHRSRTKRKSV